MRIVEFPSLFTYDLRYRPAGTQRLYNVSFRAYLRYVIYERLHNVATSYINERCFEYV